MEGHRQHSLTRKQQMIELALSAGAALSRRHIGHPRPCTMTAAGGKGRASYLPL